MNKQGEYSGQLQVKPMLLGISLGNSYYGNDDNLHKLFIYAQQHTHLVKLFLPEVFSVHNYRAVYSPNPERSAHNACRTLKNKCKKVLTNSPEIQASKFTFTDWRKEVEEADSYQQHLKNMADLFETNPEFRGDILLVAKSALSHLSAQRKNDGVRSSENDGSGSCRNLLESENVASEMEERPGSGQEIAEEEDYDVMEGSKYFLKEFAFFLAVPDIYKQYEQYDFIYHRQSLLFDRFFGGHYDGNPKPFVKFVIPKLDD